MVTHGLADLPSSLQAPPVLIYQNHNNKHGGGRAKEGGGVAAAAARGGGEGKPPPSSSSLVAEVLRAASPALPPGKQWQVFKHGGKGKGSAILHCKLFLLRFAAGAEAGDDAPGFLRVCVGTCNLYSQWQHSRGTCCCGVWMDGCACPWF